VLIDIFKIRKQNAKLEIDSTKPKVVVAKPIIAKDKEKNTKANINGIRLSNLETNHPEIGNPIKELTGIAIRIVPSSASFKSKKVFIVGMRDAQEAKHIPDKKK